MEKETQIRGWLNVNAVDTNGEVLLQDNKCPIVACLDTSDKRYTAIVVSIIVPKEHIGSVLAGLESSIGTCAASLTLDRVPSLMEQA